MRYKNVVALNAVNNDHGNVAGDKREEQPAEFAMRHIAEVGHPFDFFRRTLHHFDTEYFQWAAAATVLADHADNGNGEHENVKGKVACFGGKAVGGRAFGRIEQSPNMRMAITSSVMNRWIYARRRAI